MTIEETIALMLKNEESPAKIQEVKDAWEEKKKNKKKEEAGKTSDNATGVDAASGNEAPSTELESEDGSSELPEPARQDNTLVNFGFPEPIHNGQPSVVPELTAEEFEDLVNNLKPTPELEERVNKYPRQKKINELTGGPRFGMWPGDYPTVNTGDTEVTALNALKGLFGETKPEETPVSKTLELEEMETLMADMSGSFNNLFEGMLSSEVSELQNMQSDPVKYEDKIKSIEDKAFDELSKKYPGLSKREFQDLARVGNTGLFQQALDNQTSKYAKIKSKANIEGGLSITDEEFEGTIYELDSRLSPKMMKKKDIETAIREKNRELNSTNDPLLQEVLKGEIALLQDDKTKLATIQATTGSMGEQTGMFGSEESIDPVLAGSYMEYETTKYQAERKEEASERAVATVPVMLEGLMNSNKTMTGFEAFESLLKGKTAEKKRLIAYGDTETIPLKGVNRMPKLYNELKALGLVDDKSGNLVNVPISDLYDLGYDVRDFESMLNFQGREDMLNEEAFDKLANYEDAMYRVEGEMKTIHDQAYVNIDPATLSRGGGVATFVQTGIEATLTAFTDLRREEAIDMVAGPNKDRTASYMLEKFEEIVPVFNEGNKDKIEAGEIDELGFTKDEMKAIEKSFGEEVGEGVGHFVPMLVELGVLSAATGTVMSVPTIARGLATLRGGSGFQKATYHAVMAMIEEGKMYTVGMGATTGSSFYAGGQLTAGLTPFKSRFKWMDPLYQKVIKGGVVGAASSQLAIVSEAAYDDLMGDRDFQAAMDDHFGDLEFKDIITEAIVFGIVGASHTKKSDFMRTKDKYDAVVELTKEMENLIPLEGREKMSAKDKSKYDAYYDAKSKLQQQIMVETNALELDPNSKDFQKNFDAKYTKPMEAAIKAVIPEYKGAEVKFVDGRKQMKEESNAAEFREGGGTDGKDLILIDKNSYTPGKTVHEFTHMAMENYFKKNPGMEAKFTKKMEKIFGKFNFEAFEGTKLEEFIKEGYKIDGRTTSGKSTSAREYLAYMTEILSDPKIYNQKVATSFFKEAKQEVLSIMEENFGYRPKIRNAKEFVELLGRFSQDARRGLGFQMKASRLADLEEFDFLGIEFVENKNKKDKKREAQASKDLMENPDKSKEFFLKDSELFKAEGIETPLYSFDKHVRNEDGTRKFTGDNAKSKWQNSEEFVDFFSDVSRPLESYMEPNVLENIISKDARTRGKMSSADVDYINKVKDKLVARIMNFNPNEGGSSLFGYFENIAIPFEGKRVREEFAKKLATGEIGGNVELDRPVGEGQRSYEIESDGYFDQKFENQDLSPAAQKKHEQYLEEVGLSKEEAEAYLPTGKGIDVAKYIGMEVPKVDLSKIQFTKGEKFVPKESATFKNVGKFAMKEVGKQVYTEYYGVKGELFDIIVDTPSKNLNNDARQAIRAKMAKDVELHMLELPQGVQELISKEGDLLTPVWMSAHKNLATGLENVIEKTSFYTKTGRKGQNLDAFVMTPQLIKYHQLPRNRNGKIIVEKGSPEAEFKAEMERKYLEEIGGIINGEPKFLENGLLDKSSMIKGRDADQLLKAVVSTRVKNIYNQSVREVMNENQMAKELIHQVAAGKSGALASKDMKPIAVKLSEEMLARDVKGFPGAVDILNSDSFKAFDKKKINTFIKQLSKLDRVLKENLHGVQKDLSKQEELAVRDTQIESEMEVLEANNYKDLVSKTKESFSKDKDVQSLDLKEGLENWSKDPSKVVIQNKFDGALINQYNKSQVLKSAKTSIMSTMYQGKMARWNPVTGKMERMNLPEGNKTADGYFEFHMDTKWEGSNVDMPFLKHLKITDTGKFKTDMAKFIELNKNADNLTELVWAEGRRLLTKEGSRFEETVQAGKDARNFHLDAMREVVINHNQYGLTRAEAIQGYFRHMRAQTNITNGMVKGTATITSATKMLGVPVSKNKSAKNYLGSMYHAEHQLQLLNFTLMNSNILLRNGRNKSKYIKESRELNDLFEQSIQTKQDQLTYDSPVYGGNTGFLKSFKGKNIGELMSVLNVMYRPGVAFETVDFKSSKPATIGETIIDNYTKKQVDLLLKEVAKTGEWNSLSHELNHMNNNRVSGKNLKKIGLSTEGMKNSEIVLASKNIDKAFALGRKKKKKARGMSTFDFDETVGISDNYVIAKKGKETKRISSAEWPFQGDKMIKEGWEMDFSDFNKVTDGKPGPLMQKMKNQIKKYGPENVFILTARGPESRDAIHEYLKSEGIEIPLENITGLGKSQGEAKAQWMLEKFAEGYNDMYFVDDALPNVKAVKKVLDQLDIKSKVQLALASKDLNMGVNDIMKHSLDIAPEKTFSKAEAKIRGANIKRRRIFMTDSAADLELLLEPLYGKGNKGTENQKWFGENFVRLFERGHNDINNARQKAANGYMALRKQNKKVVKSLDQPVEGTNFTTDMALRTYIWNKNGMKIPGLAKASEAKLVEHVRNNPELQAFAENVARLTGIETGLREPSGHWWSETIASEMGSLGEGVGREKYLQDWIEAKNEIFSEENLNKMETKLGSEWRKNVEEMFTRMETGKTRKADLGNAGNAMMDYLNGSVGTIMSLNTRSATLQLISSVNFINHDFNNPLLAAKAFANQPQYWKDFAHILNSDMLKQRRSGLQINVTEAELAAAASGQKNKAKAVLAWILKQGYIPTKVCDSFAIASGGATYYRNAIRKYTKEGLSKAEAERKAWIDFQAVAERTQQSSRPDLLSAQQVSVGGRIILPFANTPMQMNRIMMKELLDIKNGRYKGFVGDNSITNKMSKVGYYGFVQSAIFAGLQSGLFALLLNSDDDELIADKKVRSVNTIADSFLRGMGIQGAVLSGIKNALLEFQKQNDKSWGADYDEVYEDLLNISPTVGSKIGKLDAAGNTYQWNKKEILNDGLTLDGPALESLTMATEALLNIPVNRVHRKIGNIQEALNEQNAAWQRIMVGLGWSQWDVGIGQRKKAEEKVEKDEAKKVKKEQEKVEAKKQVEEEKKAEEQKKKDEGFKNVRCSGIKSNGERCSITIETKAKSAKCTYHKAYKPNEGSDRNNNGVKEYQCKSLTGSGKRCKNRSENANKKCYAHQ